MTTPISQEHLKSVVSYNPETGLFVWKQRPREHFSSNRGHSSWNARFAGKEAGSIARSAGSKRFYFGRFLVINYKRYSAHRLAFLYMTGEIPEEIDHINRDATDNRWENLRPCSRTSNCMNKSIQSNNTSGVSGVYFHKLTGKYLARVTLSGRTYSAGYHAAIEDAEAAVVAKRKELGFADGHGKPQPY